MKVYFCDPASPLQRGTNENTSGLLRQYLPRRSDLSVWSLDDLTAIAEELNERPHKSLDGDTPSERMATSLDTAYTSLLRRSLGSKFPESGFPRPGRQDGLLVLGAARLKYRRVDVRHPDVRWCQAEGLNNVTGDDGPITLGVAGRQADLLVEREPAHP